MITLYQYYPFWDLPSGSPFCVKMELYLKMLGAEYQVQCLHDPRSAPKKKLPYIDDNGFKVADSGLIIDYLKEKNGLDLDEHLSIEQRAISLAFKRLIEEHLYWAIVYSRWIDEKNWKITKPTYFSAMPPVVKQVVPSILRSGIKKALKAHGLGRHSEAELYRLGLDSLKAVNNFLGNKAYFFNDKPSSLDAVAYAFLTAIIDTPLESPLREYLSSQPLLQKYVANLKKSYFPVV